MPCLRANEIKAAILFAAAILLPGRMCFSQSTQAVRTETRSSSVPTLKLPSLEDEIAIEFAGVHNLVAYAAGGLYSGSAPDGDAGFESLAALGIRTIISVDGAAPDVAAARRRGIRYVHLPIGYNGMERERTLEMARAVRELPGPIFIHCHHGKHRSAGAAGAVAVTLGLLTQEQALQRMKVSGTSPSYPGLFRCVTTAAAADAQELAQTSGEFPEIFATTSLVQSMVEMDAAFDRLALIQESGWKTPPNHPDLVPAAEAGRLADSFRTLQQLQSCRARGSEFLKLLQEGAELASTLETGLTEPRASSAELQITRERLGQSCKRCHAKFRD